MLNSKRFILVHGASHGSWCWQKVTPHLRAMGHDVIAVDLPGRNGKGNPGWRLSLQDYIEDLAQTVDRQDGKSILVGHSLAGMSISAVAERLPHKIERLIYLSAWVSKGRILRNSERRTQARNCMMPSRCRGSGA